MSMLRSLIQKCSLHFETFCNPTLPLFLACTLFYDLKLFILVTKTSNQFIKNAEDCHASTWSYGHWNCIFFHSQECLSYLLFLKAIEEKFSDNIGVNYIRFLEELQVRTTNLTVFIVVIPAGIYSKCTWVQWKSINSQDVSVKFM